MKKSYLILFYVAALMLFSGNGSAQISWEKIFSKKSSDVFRNVLEVPSGGYLAIGYSADSTANDTDAYVVRLTTSGDTIWTKYLNGSGSGKDLLYKGIITADGGFAFCGYSTNAGAANDDVFFLKMDANGSVQWTNYWGGTGRDRGQDIVQTPDGGYAITGYSTSPPAAYYDAFLLRINGAGDTLWSKLYGGGGYEDANALVLLPDSGFVLGGQASNGGNGFDMYMVRTNSLGDTLWTKKFGSIDTDNIESIIRLPDGSLILAGGTEDLTGFGGNDGIMVKTDSGGSILWSKTYGGNSQDDFHQVYQTSDNGFILSGTTRSSGPIDPNIWLMKTNAAGDSIWSQTFGGNNHDHGYGGIQTLDGGYVVVGYSSSFGFRGEEAYIAKTDGLGNISNPLTYISVSALTQPLQGSCSRNNVKVRVLVRNYGRDTVPSVPVTIQITGAITQTISETYVGNVFPGDFDTLAFSTLIDMTTPGQYVFNCTSAVLNDVNPQNNNLIATININASPTINIGPDTITFNSGQSVNLDAGAGFSQYQWSTNETSQSITVVSTSIVYVTVTDANNCTASDTVFVSELVGIDDLISNTDIQIFPNPSAGKFEIKLDKASSSFEITILNILGAQVYSDRISGSSSYKKSIDFSSQAKGIYFLQLKFNDGIVTKRIFLQ